MLPLHVHRTTFKSVLPDVTALIKKATFIAIDLEFTGLWNDPKYQPQYFDTYHERLRKIQSGIADFLCLQVGLAIFIETVSLPLSLSLLFTLLIQNGLFIRQMANTIVTVPISICSLVQAEWFERDGKHSARKSAPFISSVNVVSTSINAFNKAFPTSPNQTKQTSATRWQKQMTSHLFDFLTIRH